MTRAPETLKAVLTFRGYPEHETYGAHPALAFRLDEVAYSESEATMAGESPCTELLGGPDT